MPNKEEDGTLGIKLSPKSERLFENLPDKFNRQTVLSIGKKLGIPQRTAEKYVGEYVNKHGLCKRTGNGEYEKVKQQKRRRAQPPTDAWKVLKKVVSLQCG